MTNVDDVRRIEIKEFLSKFPTVPQRGGKVYLEVKYRLAALHKFFPNARVTSGTMVLPPGHIGQSAAAVGTATVCLDAKNAPEATYEAQAMHQASPTVADFIANANTSAIGRALALAGIGTELVADFDEERDADGNIKQMAEAPYPTRQPAAQVASSNPRPVTEPTPIRPSVTAQPAIANAPLLTERQGKALYAMTMAECGSDHAIRQKWTGDTRNLTFQQASAALDWLNKRKQAGLQGAGDLPEWSEVLGGNAPIGNEAGPLPATDGGVPDGMPF